MLKSFRSSLALMLGFSLSLAGLAQTPSPSPGGPHILDLKVAKLVDKSLAPKEIDIQVQLQTGGLAVSSLTLFYKRSESDQYLQSKCDLPAGELYYHAVLPYADSIDYYFSATPPAGDPVMFGRGTINGTVLPTWKMAHRPLLSAGAGGLGSLAGFLVALTLGGAGSSGQPSTSPPPPSPSSSSKSHYSWKIGVAGAGAAGLITFFVLKHRKLVKQNSNPDKSASPRKSDATALGSP